MLEELSQLPLASKTQVSLHDPAADRDSLHLTEEERAVLQELTLDERSIDQIIDRSGLPASTVAATLLRLEMKSFAKQLPGSYFVRSP
jgi:predicted Rossmann fold nucleotide-binding protein DprA/Smf involved in DNA uptake